MRYARLETKLVKTIHLRDDPGTYDVPHQILVTDYESGSWEGSGYAYALLEDGTTVREISIGHCSCFGPWEGGFSGEPAPFTDYSLADFADLVEGDRVTVGGLRDLPAATRFLAEVRSVQVPA